MPLHRVRAQVKGAGDQLVAVACGDARKHLGFTLAQEYAQLSFTRGGVAYVSDGFVQFDFDAQGRLSSGSGTVTISANGEPIARISATSGGFAVDILSAPPGFAAASPSINRTRVGAAKAPAQGARNKRF